MANSSDWLTALVERSGGDRSGSSTPPSWLTDCVELEGGFKAGLPIERSSEGYPESPPPQAEGTTDELVDILREALDEGEQAADEVDPARESEIEQGPDPITEAFQRGEQAGRQAALVEAGAKHQQQLALRQTFRALDQAAMDTLAGELADTVISLCSQTLANYTPDGEALAERCKAAAERLGAGANVAALRLHPDDLALLDKTALGDWRVLGDPSVERGGVRFETEDGSVSDCPSDWRRAISAAIRG
ncbi:FliH/SctL family protein [uncultured Erythrobacter sp.]|uniref:FliH/SctL family protein n=1 Tax=uncultured Erythrobacter sp. TaxID=263913 RepID=UPI00262CD6C6|nr:FliH/SctL family protein [uncultured Erythrobacter sp.]